MKSVWLRSAILSAILCVTLPAFGHVGHGDEFQATGDVQRVRVQETTDRQLGIQVDPIEPASDGSSTVWIPVTALVEDNDKTYVFVRYENFYEPVEVVTGATQNDAIEITEGLSVGEELVVQGGLTLYAQSRRAQPSEVAETQTEAPTETTATTSESSFPIMPFVALGGLTALVAIGGSWVLLSNGNKRR
ncbi:MAG: cobalt transporter [Cyanobacteria bacterium SID2]|nr:cobalt transporter [Cyanobacteria bacterium SID2]MBP0003938.1 cobalt transporter [Cyanobacteria bacterium SBC]